MPLVINAFVRFWLFALPRLLISRFSFLEPPSVEITRGVFLSPETFPRKIFPKIFSNLPKRLFADFLARICDEGKGCLLPAHRGGVSLSLLACWASRSLSFFRSSLAPALSLVPCGLPAFHLWTIGATLAHWEHLGASGRPDYGSSSNRAKVGKIG